MARSRRPAPALQQAAARQTPLQDTERHQRRRDEITFLIMLYTTRSGPA